MVVEKTAKQQRNSLLVCSFRNDLEIEDRSRWEESYIEKDTLRQELWLFSGQWACEM